MRQREKRVSEAPDAPIGEQASPSSPSPYPLTPQTVNPKRCQSAATDLRMCCLHATRYTPTRRPCEPLEAIPPSNRTSHPFLPATILPLLRPRPRPRPRPTPAHTSGERAEARTANFPAPTRRESVATTTDPATPERASPLGSRVRLRKSSSKSSIMSTSIPPSAPHISASTSSSTPHTSA